MIPLTVFGIPSNVVGMGHEVYIFFFKSIEHWETFHLLYYYYRPNCFLLLGPQRESITRANTHLIGGQKEECQGFIIIGSTAIQFSHSWPSRNLLLCIIITYLYHCWPPKVNWSLGSAQLLLLLLVQFT